MPSVTFAGTISSPLTGESLGGAEILFHAVRTSATVVEGTSASTITNVDGDYSITVEYGRYDIFVKADKARSFTRIAEKVLINEDTTEADVNQLAYTWQAEEDITPEIVVEFRHIRKEVGEERAHVDSQVEHVDTKTAHVDDQTEKVDADAEQVAADRLAAQQARTGSEDARDAGQTARDESRAWATGDGVIDNIDGTDRYSSRVEADRAADERQGAEDAATASSDSATLAKRSEDAASGSASAAAGSEDSAAQSASTARTQAGSATDSASDALAHKNSASTSAGNASSNATQASNSASEAATSEANASSYASSAAASETESASSANAAKTARQGSETAQSGAQSARTAAESARDQAQEIFNQFGDQYLGPFASDPATDNSGNPLTEGDIYFNTADDTLKFYSGTSWVAPETIASNAAANAQNSASAASASESAAADSENAASGYASDALAYRDTAASHANAASSSAGNAAGSANTANTKANEASTSAGNAADSATAAGNSESAAASSAADASGSASAASSSANDAEHWAEEAQSAAQQEVYWGDVLSKPASYPPSSHDHDGCYVRLSGAGADVEDPGNGGLAIRTNDNNGEYIFQAKSSSNAPRLTVVHGATELKGDSSGWKIGSDPVATEPYVDQQLDDKLDKLDKTAKAADSDKLDGKHLSELLVKSEGGVVLGNLLLAGDGRLNNQTASIALALGDSDTGFKWIKDGVFQIYANNRAIADVSREAFNSLKPLQEGGNQVYHSGNFDPASKLAAADYTAADVLDKLASLADEARQELGAAEQTSYTGAIVVPSGTTSQRPSGDQKYLRYNTDTKVWEGYDGANWNAIGGGGGDTSNLSEVVATWPLGVPQHIPTDTDLPDCAVLDGSPMPSWASTAVKTMYGDTLPDYRGRTPVGTDEGSGRVGDAWAKTPGQGGGADRHQLGTNEMPSHDHAASASTDGYHGHSGSTGNAGNHRHELLKSFTTVSRGPRKRLVVSSSRNNSNSPNYRYKNSSGNYWVGSSGNHSHGLRINGNGNHSHNISIGHRGGNAAHNNMQPSIAGRWVMKLK